MRKPIIVGNWKMNKTIADTKAFVEAVDGKVTDGADWGSATPYLALQTAKAEAKNLLVAAENCHFKDSGAYTGEVSVEMLKEIGVEWVILGHSERRQYFGETDETVNAKMLQVLKNDMTPIVCVGETLEEYEAGTTKDVVKKQTVAAFKDVCPKCANRDNFELATFKTYIEENGFSSVDAIATETGITQKNVTRYLEYQNIANEPDMKSQKFTGSGIVLN